MRGITAPEQGDHSPCLRFVVVGNVPGRLFVSKFFESLSELFKQYIAGPLLHLEWTDIVDILLLAVLFYFVYSFARMRRAGKLTFGLFIILLLYVISDIFGLLATHKMLEVLASFGIIILAVIFQPELRTALEKIGNSVTDLRSGINQRHAVMATTISEVVEAACQIATQEHDGALIVIERTTKLGDYADNGTKLDALVSSSLLTGIFVNKAPLHDGAVIISGDRVVAAACKLPIKTSGEVAHGLGTRHRAAIGISEVSDCVVVIVSEERHVISVANSGYLKRDYNPNGMDDLKSEESLKAVQNRLRADLFLLLTGKDADMIESQLEKNQKKQQAKDTQKKATYRPKRDSRGESADETGRVSDDDDGQNV